MKTVDDQTDVRKPYRTHNLIGELEGLHAAIGLAEKLERQADTALCCDPANQCDSKVYVEMFVMALVASRMRGNYERHW